ncbi:MAG: type II toxin-antitoxin system VapC family toxin [Nitrososphaerales archaeon]
MARVKKVVVDASVIVRWYVQEEWSDSARRVRQDYEKGLVELIAPYLLFYEVSNSLRHSADLNANDVSDSMTSLINTQLDTRLLTKEDIEKTVTLAFQFGITMYDAVYFALSQSIGVNFLTGDLKLYKKLGSDNVVLLSDYDYSKI